MLSNSGLYRTVWMYQGSLDPLPSTVLYLSLCYIKIVTVVLSDSNSKMENLLIYYV